MTSPNLKSAFHIDCFLGLDIQALQKKESQHVASIHIFWLQAAHMKSIVCLGGGSRCDVKSCSLMHHAPYVESGCSNYTIDFLDGVVSAYL
jgi:hypothetical protein